MTNALLHGSLRGRLIRVRLTVTADLQNAFVRAGDEDSVVPIRADPGVRERAIREADRPHAEQLVAEPSAVAVMATR